MWLPVTTSKIKFLIGRLKNVRFSFYSSTPDLTTTFLSLSLFCILKANIFALRAAHGVVSFSFRMLNMIIPFGNGLSIKFGKAKYSS